MTGAEDRDPYAVLGVGRDASAREISRAYRQQMRRHHPDTAADPPGTAADRGALAEVQAAYALLRDGAARARYDAGHPVARPTPARSGPPAPDPAWSAPERSGDESGPPLRAGPVHWRPHGPRMQ
jgi:DnaJ-class molecular chaperone